MKWIRERDALIAQTLAFVQSVTGRTAEFGLPEAPGASPDLSAEILSVRSVEITSVRTVESIAVAPVEAAVGIEPQQPSPPPPQPFQLAPPTPRGEVRSEMQARIANFRKHQERFEREREEYCAATLTKLRAAIRDPSFRPPAGKA